jgi:hypothetical protein
VLSPTTLLLLTSSFRCGDRESRRLDLGGPGGELGDAVLTASDLFITRALGVRESALKGPKQPYSGRRRLYICSYFSVPLMPTFSLHGNSHGRNCGAGFALSQ